MWKWLLEKVMNYIVGKDVFGKVQNLVATVALDDTLSGEEKREKVKTEAKDLGTDFATHMLNLSVEAAVTLLREKQQQ
jgi:hypothetical protein